MRLECAGRHTSTPTTLVQIPANDARTCKEEWVQVCGDNRGSRRQEEGTDDAGHQLCETGGAV